MHYNICLLPGIQTWFSSTRTAKINDIGGKMAIIINLDVMLAKRKMKLKTLSEIVDITTPNLSILKQGKAKAIKLSTLDKICSALDCQPGDLLEYKVKTE